MASLAHNRFDPKRSVYTRKPLAAQFGSLVARATRVADATAAAKSAVDELRRKYGDAAVPALLAAMNIEMPEESTREQPTDRQDRRLPPEGSDATAGGGERGPGDRRVDAQP